MLWVLHSHKAHAFFAHKEIVPPSAGDHVVASPLSLAHEARRWTPQQQQQRSPLVFWVCARACLQETRCPPTNHPPYHPPYHPGLQTTRHWNTNKNWVCETDCIFARSKPISSPCAGLCWEGSAPHVYVTLDNMNSVGEPRQDRCGTRTTIRCGSSPSSTPSSSSLPSSNAQLHTKGHGFVFWIEYILSVKKCEYICIYIWVNGWAVQKWVDDDGPCVPLRVAGWLI